MGDHKKSRKKHTIEEMQEIAKSRGGDCLSEDYINNRTKLKWRCADGHEWKAIPYTIKKGSWCPYCAKVVKLTIDDMHNIAKERGGECLSSSYINVDTKLKWRCSEGHEWEATPYNVRNGTWCPFCAGTVKLTIEEMEKIARDRNGQCLSKEYINARTNLKWRCSDGHVWEAVPDSIKRGKWCPYCGHAVKLTIEEMQEIAKSRGGECLSHEYINARTNLKWRCGDGHEWEATPSSIKGGSWCPHCTIYVSEKICREIFERLFNKSFPKKRPKWLINPSTKNKMELDGYCEDLKLAFEYQGLQHYEETYFTKTRSLLKQIEVDEIKKQLCNKNDIKLIEVPYYIEYDQLPNYIISECQKQGISVPNINLEIFDYHSFDIYSSSRLEEMQEIAKTRGGECLSSSYINVDTKLKWRCSEGHEWETIPEVIKRGGWCPYCAKVIKHTIEEMQKIARERGGDCLSEDYIDNRTKLKWCCSEGHEWEAIPSNIFKGHWCPYCAGSEKSSIEDMQKIAQQRGGECLSNEYVNALTKLKWRCSKGHEWEATPNNVKNNNTWCLICSGSKKGTIEEMKMIAKKRGGECLSNEYVNAMTKLRWCCKEGHEWESVPSSIKTGTWCPYCGGSAKLNIEEMQKIAGARNGKCLSQEYINAKTKLKWRCADGHEWKTSPDNIKQGKWCPYCAGIVKLTIEDMKDIAEERGGECLSENYINSNTKLKWRCSNDHEWEAVPSSIKTGTWCPYCHGNIKLTIQEMQEIAKASGGECLSDKYINSQTKLKWRCSEGHEWEATPNGIIGGKWCPYCAGNIKLTIEDMQKIARERGGECLSSSYININSKLKWRCADGHEWEAKPSHVKKGSWCPYCAGSVKLTIEEMQEIAKSRGGECLSKEYINARTNLKWRCSDGHVWEAVPDSIKRGRWCPYCYGNIKLTIQDLQKIAQSRGGECLSNKYINNYTKLKWRCREGHEWEANSNDIKRGRWCPICARKNQS